MHLATLLRCSSQLSRRRHHSPLSWEETSSRARHLCVVDHARPATGHPKRASLLRVVSLRRWEDRSAYATAFARPRRLAPKTTPAEVVDAVHAILLRAASALVLRDQKGHVLHRTRLCPSKRCTARQTRLQRGRVSPESPADDTPCAILSPLRAQMRSALFSFARFGPESFEDSLPSGRRALCSLGEHKTWRRSAVKRASREV
jgi:hypothetical protein